MSISYNMIKHKVVTHYIALKKMLLKNG